MQPSLHLAHDADYREIIDAQFMALAVKRGLTRFRGLSWPTECEDLDAVGEVLYAASYDYNKSRCLVANLGSVTAFLVLEKTRFGARLAASSEEELDAAERRLRAEVPRSESDPNRQQAVVAFWHADRHHGGVCRYTRLPVPRWGQIAPNYAGDTRTQLETIVRSFQPGHGGRLMLWTGAPGTGKTYALRALAWEWRSWCAVHYVTDPDAMFGSRPEYMAQLVMHSDPPSKTWKLLVLEDTGELLTADAKSRTGQGLSRLLNVVDGLMGQGFPTLVLVTTNEDVRSLHPAIARPGRCAQHVEFGALSEEEAQTWLGEHACERAVRGAHTLAELYALADGRASGRRLSRRVGFAA